MIVIATIHPWNLELAQAFKARYKNVRIISRRSDLTPAKMARLNPEYIFFPHWSWFIEPEIYERYECVIFHMTDLPFGRGGSPLQNLIVRGFTKTKISALKAVARMDEGPIYLKKPLVLSGNAEEIYLRASKTIFEEMIPYIINNRPLAKPQQGRAVIFKRRLPQQSNLQLARGLKGVFDHIRMLDAPGYPKAFIQFSKFTVEFSKAELKKDSITANVQIRMVP